MTHSLLARDNHLESGRVHGKINVGYRSQVTKQTRAINVFDTTVNENPTFVRTKERVLDATEDLVTVVVRGNIMKKECPCGRCVVAHSYGATR